MSAAVALGPLALPAGAVSIAAALGVAAMAGSVAARESRAAFASTLVDLLLVALLVARLGFVALWFDQYLGAPWTMLDIRDGGFLPVAGVLGAAAFAAWKGWRTRPLRAPLAVALTCGGLAWGLLAALPGTAGAGRPLPQSQLERLEGGSTSLAALAQGKPTVVNLWATWCPPCRREMPVLAEAQRTHGDVQFVFADQGEGREAVRSFIDAHVPGLRNVLLDPGGRLGHELSAPGLPTTLFFDARGRLVDTHMGALSSATLAASLDRAR